jgi:hypothetical protein
MAARYLTPTGNRKFAGRSRKLMSPSRWAYGIRAGILLFGLMRASWAGIALALGVYGLLRRFRGLPRRDRDRSIPQSTAYGMSGRRPSLMRHRPPVDLPSDEVERESQDGFPASDAPSWTPVTRIGTPMLRKGE